MLTIYFLFVFFYLIYQFQISKEYIPSYKMLKYFGIGLFLFISFFDIIDTTAKIKISPSFYDSAYQISIFTIITGLLLQILSLQKNIQISFYFKIGDIFFWKEKSMKYKVNNIENGYIEFYSIDNYDIENLSLKDALSKLRNETFVKQN